MNTNEDQLDDILEFKRKLRGTKVKGKRLFCILELERLNAATKHNLLELKKLKKEISDWEPESDYYREMYRLEEESWWNRFVKTISSHPY